MAALQLFTIGIFRYSITGTIIALFMGNYKIPRSRNNSCQKQIWNIAAYAPVVKTTLTVLLKRIAQNLPFTVKSSKLTHLLR